MQVCFTCDEGARLAQSSDEPGILGGDSIRIAIEFDAATGRRASEIETILYGNRQTPKRVATIAE